MRVFLAFTISILSILSLQNCEHYDIYGRLIGSSEYNYLLKRFEHYTFDGQFLGFSRYPGSVKGDRIEHYSTAGTYIGFSEFNETLEQVDHFLFLLNGIYIGSSRLNEQLGRVDHYDSYGRFVGSSECLSSVEILEVSSFFVFVNWGK